MATGPRATAARHRCSGAIRGQASGTGRAPVTAPPEAVENDQRGADRDRAVGDVEGGIEPAPPVEQKEVDHEAERQPIPEIAQRAAEDQGESRAVPAIAAA